ncbi:hypothetical protein [Nannocystis sp.]|uniref:hypothetical protein n=1 Tax=Nannocystis sp. TaxID=1962667 RepID=UPI0025DE6302|nr:hypothetical protein [Nannocystis sp.]MBK7823675.1 hypothetical protein [Nannocystis sp.]
MKIALFVEGSTPVGSKDQCARLWNTLLPALGRTSVDVVVPIGKDAITNMLGLPGSTSAPGLDARICDARRTHKLDPARDALIVAWDLEPPVDKDQRRCAWDEKIGVYQGIASSPLALLRDTAWAACAAKAATQLENLRDVPPTGRSQRTVKAGAVLAVCMEPMFEALFTHDGRAVRRALDLKDDPPGWPTGWGPNERDPSRKLMGPAIAAIHRMRPAHPVRKIIRETWRNAKDEWGEYILRKLLADETQRKLILEHAISRRLKNILPRSKD